MKPNWVEKVWLNSPPRLRMLRRETELFKKIRDLPPGAEVLEIGCGRGFGVRLIRRAFAPRRFEAVDIDEGAVRRLAKRKEFLGMKDVVFGVADAQRLTYADRSLDAVFTFGILHHLEDWQRGVREIHRVLRPGGAFYFEEIYPALYANAVTRRLLVHPRENRFDGPRLRDELKLVGFRLLDGYAETAHRVVAVALKP